MDAQIQINKKLVVKEKLKPVKEHLEKWKKKLNIVEIRNSSTPQAKNQYAADIMIKHNL